MLGDWTQSLAHAKEELYHWVTLSAPKLHCSTFFQLGVKRTQLWEPITNFMAHIFKSTESFVSCLKWLQQLISTTNKNQRDPSFQFTSHKAPSSEALPRKSEIQSSANMIFLKSLCSFTHTQFTLFLFSITQKVLRSRSYVHCSELKCWDVTSFSQQSHSQTSQGRKWNKQGRLWSTPFPDTATEWEMLWPSELPLSAL